MLNVGWLIVFQTAILEFNFYLSTVSTEFLNIDITEFKNKTQNKL